MVGMGLVLFQLTARYGTVLLRLEVLERATGLLPRTPAPAFDLPDLDGRPLSLGDVLARDRPALLVFVSPTCANCSELLPDLERWRADPGHALSLVVISDGRVEANREKFAAAPSLPVLLQSGWAVADMYGVEGTPAAVLIGADGTVVSEVTYAVGPIRRLHDETVQQLEQAGAAHHHGHDHAAPELPAVAPGDPLPTVQVTDEAGRQLSVADAVGDDRVLLFWRTDCTFCEGITDDVARLEGDTPLLLVTGTPTEAVRASGLTSPILREQYDELSDALQVPGTPSAVRTRGGVVDSHVAVGGPEVLKLIAESATVGAAKN
jgi:peroxiredoxin